MDKLFKFTIVTVLNRTVEEKYTAIDIATAISKFINNSKLPFSNVIKIEEIN